MNIATEKRMTEKQFIAKFKKEGFDLYKTKDLRKQLLSHQKWEDKISKDFTSSARLLIRHLAENHHPHHTAIVTSTGAELLEGKEFTGKILDYIVD